VLTRTLPRFGSRRAVHVFERNFTVYRSQWIMLLSGFFEPLFYLLSIGIGSTDSSVPCPRVATS